MDFTKKRFAERNGQVAQAPPSIAFVIFNSLQTFTSFFLKTNYSFFFTLLYTYLCPLFVYKMKELLDTFPEIELRCVTSGDKTCDCCSGRNPTRSFEFRPYKYDPVTLDRIDVKTALKV